jgi:hypothetical protein
MKADDEVEGKEATMAHSAPLLTCSNFQLDAHGSSLMRAGLFAFKQNQK